MYTNLNQIPNMSDESIYTNLKSRFDAGRYTTDLGYFAFVQVNYPTLKWSETSAFVNKMYLHMMRDGTDQMLYILGDSLTGKSLAYSKVLHFLSSKSFLGTNGAKNRIALGIPKISTLFDIFSKCSISTHINASKCLLYQELQYENELLVGIKTLEYGLDVNRVLGSISQESNFNIFYLLLSGLPRNLKSSWQLQDSHHFRYLSSSVHPTFTESDFKGFRKALKTVGIALETQMDLFKILVSLLHLGNVTFTEFKKQEPVLIKNRQVLELVSTLLGVSVANLENLLTFKSKIIQGEVCAIVMNIFEAQENRDLIVKCLYRLTFSWVLEKINDTFCVESVDTFIGVLDVVGMNSCSKKASNFEQFLFNYANERVKVNANVTLWNQTQVYSYKQGLCQDEGYCIEHSCTDLIYNGILPLLSRQTIQAQHSKNECCLELHSSFLDKMEERFARNPVFKSCKLVKKGSTLKSALFTLVHYKNTVVEYDFKDFYIQNVDCMHSDLISLVQNGSSNVLFKEFFDENILCIKNLESNKNVIESAQLSMDIQRRPSKSKSKSKEPSSTVEITHSQTLERDLNELFEATQNVQSWQILCLSHHPRGIHHGKSWDSTYVKRQVANYDLMGLIRYQSSHSYIVSYPYKVFVDKFKCLYRSGNSDANTPPRVHCQRFAIESSWEKKDIGFGRTEFFLSESLWNELHALLEKSRQKSFSMVKSIEEDYEFDSESSEEENESFYPSKSDVEAPSYDHRKPPHTSIGQDQEIEDEEDEENSKKPKISPARRKWVCCTWFLTWYIPSCCLSNCGRMKRKDVQMAFREKLALNIIIYFMCAVLLFYIGIFGKLICPKQTVLSSFELNGKTDINDPFVSAYGRVYQIGEVVDTHYKSYGIQNYMFASKLGQDVSYLFYKVPLFTYYCPNIPLPSENWDNLISRPLPSPENYAHKALDPNTKQVKFYLENLNQYARFRLAWPLDYIAKASSAEKRLIVLYDNVYDVSAYFNSLNPFFGTEVGVFFSNHYGTDATAQWNKLVSRDPTKMRNILNCMNNMFYVGTVDHRNDFRCQFSNYALLATSILLVAVIGFKFLAALQFGSHKDPESHDKFVLIMVPCYTEGSDSLVRTLESLANLKYDDKRKLLFIIADGMVMGSGNDRPTPQLVLEILGINPELDQTLAYSYQSLGEGDKQHNMGKVYSGLYQVQGHAVPFIMISKVGKPSERSRPGNRGKRDSQMIVMNFFSRVHFNQAMSPMELEIYRHLNEIIGVNPSFYEYCLMVDADTEVYPDSLTRMVSTMIHDSKIMGLCGETLLANEKDSAITMIQVYEYFISHHLAKAFESLFGSVTCLPGCFCMYRIRASTKNVPLLIAPSVIKDYSENVVNTLHLKNLLHLGEDRYLTTLMMKHFPQMKLSFTADAICKTNAPDRWSVLVSQRRRWINSTVHNLLELVFLPQLCGFCCFSMRFVVFMDLFSTIVQPVGVLYIGYLIYMLTATDESFPVISMILLAAIYGFQVIIFILKRQWAQIGWMLVYILAMPAFSFYLPIYSFWHFDDFSWGSTRQILGEKKGSKKALGESIDFDPNSIPLAKWNPSSSGRVSSSLSASKVVHYESAPFETLPKLEMQSRQASMDSFSMSGFSSPLHYASSRVSTPLVSTSRLSHTSEGFVTLDYPSEATVAEYLKTWLSTQDLNSITKKQVREQVYAHFKMQDVESKKEWIHSILDHVLKNLL